ncbi:hypothetical protein EOL96_08505 [Candidatus Saccharibacteria bacterium]|nr:hypothetical protein [Candidatus Saccharibacteria bacterium]
MKRSKLPKLKKGAWFVAVRGSYLPMTWQSWLLYVPYTTYSVATLVMVITRAQSWLDYLALVPYWVAGLVVMTWIAKQKS